MRDSRLLMEKILPYSSLLSQDRSYSKALIDVFVLRTVMGISDAVHVTNDKAGFHCKSSDGSQVHSPRTRLPLRLVRCGCARIVQRLQRMV